MGALVRSTWRRWKGDNGTDPHHSAQREGRDAGNGLSAPNVKASYNSDDTQLRKKLFFLHTLKNNGAEQKTRGSLA